MRTMSVLAALLLAATLGTGCNGDDEKGGGGGTGGPVDTGAPPSGDTGTPPTGDTGLPPAPDTGAPPTRDTGTPPTGDTGTPPTGDTGPEPEGTSANGLWIVPEAFQGIKEVTAEKEGMAFATAKAATKPGFSYFVAIKPENTPPGPDTAGEGCQCPGTRCINVSGAVRRLDGQDAAGLIVAPISPLDALAAPTPTPIADPVVTGPGGAFSFRCVNVSTVLLGLVLLVDDPSQDGTPSGQAGAIFPTGTGVKAWSTELEKTDVENAVVFALPTALLADLDEELGKQGDQSLENTGFAMGIVVGPEGPVAGARVVLASGDPLNVRYFKADLSGLK